MSTRIYPEELALEDGLVAMRSELYKAKSSSQPRETDKGKEPAASGDDKGKAPAASSDDKDEVMDDDTTTESDWTLNRLAELGTLDVICLHLRLQAPRRRAWSGISESELSMIRDFPTDCVRDQLVAVLDKAMDLTFLTSWKKNATRVFANKLDLFGRLLTLAKVWGCFWHYRMQLWYAYAMETDEEGDLHAADIDDPVLPSFNFVEPRWLVKSWEFDVTSYTDGRASEWSNPRPVSWETFYLADSYPDVRHVAFLMKMAVRSEQDLQIEEINKFARSNGQVFFKARVHPLGSVDSKTHRYLMELNWGTFTQNLSNLAKTIRLPGPGTRIELQMDRDGGAQILRPVKLSGNVVSNMGDLDCAIVCVVETNQGALKIRHEIVPDVPVLLSYIHDALPYQRQLTAIQVLQQAGASKVGPDVRSFVFRTAPSTQDPGILARGITKDHRTRIDLVVGRFKLNTMQKRSIEHTFKGEPLTIIHGPPGTGKTETITALAASQLSVGHRIMYTAPSNAAVRTLIDKFLESNARLPENFQQGPFNWVLFQGAFSTVAASRKLQARGSVTDQDLAAENAENAAFAFYETHAETKEAPNYQWTFGYKLSVFIDECLKPNASVPGPDPARAFDLAQSFKQADDVLKYGNDKDERKKARDMYRIAQREIGLYYMKHVVKVVFCTLSTSAHEIVAESGPWHVAIIDECASETLPGVAVALAAHRDNVWHWVWAGDHHQMEGIMLSQDRNVGMRVAGRSIFGEFAGGSEQPQDGDDAPSTNVFMLTTCYRMPEDLIEWSSNKIYNGKVTADRETARNYELELSATHKAFIDARCTPAVAAHHRQVAFDQTGEDIKSNIVKDSTTRVNEAACETVVWLVKDMLTFKPPADTQDVKYRKIRGSDILILSPYSGEVPVIRRNLLKPSPGHDPIPMEELGNVQVMTIASSLGKQGNIVFFCTTVAPGTPRLQHDEALSIGYVANINNLNVALTRCRIARHVIGALGTYDTAYYDGHFSTKRKNALFFGFIRDLLINSSVVSRDELDIWRREKRAPKPEDKARTFIQMQPRNLEAIAAIPEQSLPQGAFSVAEAQDSATRVTKTQADHGNLVPPPGVNMTYTGPRGTPAQEKAAIGKAAEGKVVKNKKKRQARQAKAKYSKGTNNGNPPPPGAAGPSTAAT